MSINRVGVASQRRGERGLISRNMDVMNATAASTAVVLAIADEVIE
jgi:hypothetical protein